MSSRGETVFVSTWGSAGKHPCKKACDKQHYSPNFIKCPTVPYPDRPPLTVIYSHVAINDKLKNNRNSEKGALQQIPTSHKSLLGMT